MPNLHIGIIDTKEVEKTTRAKNKCVYRLDSELHSPKIILTVNIIIVVITRVFKKLMLGLYSLGVQVFNPKKLENANAAAPKVWTQLVLMMGNARHFSKMTQQIPCRMWKHNLFHATTPADLISTQKNL